MGRREESSDIRDWGGEAFCIQTLLVKEAGGGGKGRRDGPGASFTSGKNHTIRLRIKLFHYFMNAGSCLVLVDNSHQHKLGLEQPPPRSPTVENHNQSCKVPQNRSALTLSLTAPAQLLLQGM